MTTAEQTGERVRGRKPMPVIDCDVHNEFRSYAKDLLPHIPAQWRHYITNRGFPGVALQPYTPWMGSDRRDTWMPDGTRGSAYFEVLRDQHLDAWEIEYAILTGSAGGTTVCYLGQHDWAAALAQATNDYAIAEWYDKDPRIKGSIVIAAQHPEAAVREIDRCADHPNVIQVMLPTRSPSGIPWSDEKYHPIWAAAQRHGLVVGFHVNPMAGNVLPPTSAGWPRSYMELSTGYVIGAQSELIGLLCRGTFERFPGLKMVMVENGFGWWPSLCWRLDKHWRELRAEVPWLKRRPSEYAREHIRFTTQPMEEPDDPQHLLQLIDMMGSEEFLLFSTDYPHWNFDSPERSLPSAIPDDLKRKILAGNARELYGLSDG